MEKKDHYRHGKLKNNSFVKIIKCISSLKKKGGGTSFLVSDLSDGLVNNGVDVILISQFLKKEKFSLNDFYLPSQKKVQIELIQIENNFFKKIYAYSYRLKLNQCLNQNVDLLHLTGIWEPSSHASIIFAKKHSIPTVISPQGMLEPWALNNNFIKKKIAWHLYQKKDLNFADVIHATAEKEAENLRKLGLKQPIAIIPNGINFSNYNDSKKFYSKKDDRQQLLFLSRIHPKKGLIELVKAWENLNPKKWKVVVAGPDEDGHRLEVENLIKEKKLNHSFEFIGPVDGKYKYDLYKSSDLFVLPTYSENFGIVVAEALMSEIPVITTKGAPWEGLIKNNCGWWIDIGVDPLTYALDQALSMPSEKLKQMGKRGRIFAQENFGNPTIAKKMLDVYKWILDKKNKPSFIV